MIDQVIAVDPGRVKCGVAIVDRYRGGLWKKVIATGDLVTTVQNLGCQHQILTVVIGNRTTSRSAMKDLSTVKIEGQALMILPVDEHRSSDEARSRYWIDHPPRGLMRLFPVTMRTPPVPVDDYVAVVIAERYFCRKNP